MEVYDLVLCVLLLLRIGEGAEEDNDIRIMTTDEMENFINPEDLNMIVSFYQKNSTLLNPNATDQRTTTPPPEPPVGCFGIGGFMIRAINKIFSFNLRPAASHVINTQFYFSSRNMNYRVQVYPGREFGLESVDFDPKRKTVVIVHGFMSYSGADWVIDMTHAYLEWEDVNVIAVDWSGGSSTFKYWRAVANTRTVGRDIVTFMGQLKNATGLNIKDCHFIGHSLGAQIVSFASQELGIVGRITACLPKEPRRISASIGSNLKLCLDPALPCFNTSSTKDRLDPTDADFVDVIHTNGQLTSIGFGFPYPTGHVDFYPNGGIRQPGCLTSKIPLYNTIDQAICSHGRSYLLFTESLTNKHCKFRGFSWDLSVSGLRKSLQTSCQANSSICPEMGIRVDRNTRGRFLVITEDREPYCVSDWDQQHPSPNLLDEIVDYLQHLTETTISNGASTISSIIPFNMSSIFDTVRNISAAETKTTTERPSWFRRVYNYLMAHKEELADDVDINYDY